MSRAFLFVESKILKYVTSGHCSEIVPNVSRETMKKPCYQGFCYGGGEENRKPLFGGITAVYTVKMSRRFGLLPVVTDSYIYLVIIKVVPKVVPKKGQN